jgi:sugar lactone lactonase YvrE
LSSIKFGLAWQNRLFVSDLLNYRVLVFPFTKDEGAPDGEMILGQQGAGAAIHQINQIYGMAIDSLRNILYLSDSLNHRILRLHLLDQQVSITLGTGSAGTNNLSLNQPLGLTVDESTDDIFVADSLNHRIQRINPQSGIAMTMVGLSHSNELKLPSGVALDKDGHLYIADTANHRIVQWLRGAREGRRIAGHNPR